MKVIAVDYDGSVTIKLTADEAKKIRDDLHETGQPWDASYTLSRHIAIVHGEPACRAHRHGGFSASCVDCGHSREADCHTRKGR